MVGFEQLALATPHQNAIVVGAMVPAENVKHSVNDEKSHLVIEASGVCRCLLFGDLRTDHHVTEKKGQIGRIDLRTIGAATSSARIDFDDVATIDRKRQDVSRATTRHVRDVQLGHVADRDEEDAEFAGPSNTFGLENPTGERLPTFEIDGDVILFIGTEHFGDSLAADTWSTTQTRWPRVHCFSFDAELRS